MSGWQTSCDLQAEISRGWKASGCHEHSSPTDLVPQLTSAIGTKAPPLTRFQIHCEAHPRPDSGKRANSSQEQVNPDALNLLNSCQSSSSSVKVEGLAFRVLERAPTPTHCDRDARQQLLSLVLPSCTVKDDYDPDRKSGRNCNGNGGTKTHYSSIASFLTAQETKLLRPFFPTKPCTQCRFMTHLPGATFEARVVQATGQQQDNNIAATASHGLKWETCVGWCK